MDRRKKKITSANIESGGRGVCNLQNANRHYEGKMEDIDIVVKEGRLKVLGGVKGKIDNAKQLESKDKGREKTRLLVRGKGGCGTKSTVKRGART